MMTVGLFDARFLDPQSKGSAYMVMPDFMKDPLQYTIQYTGEDTVTTKAGTFRVNKLIFVIADPFVGKLMDSFLKSTYDLVEDSGRRLVIKSQAHLRQLLFATLLNSNNYNF
jgi:hypothetical protein